VKFFNKLALLFIPASIYMPIFPDSPQLNIGMPSAGMPSYNKPAANMPMPDFNDPEFMQAFDDIMNDPKAMEEIESLMNDPAIMNQVEEMMSNPEMMKQIDEMTKTFEDGFAKKDQSKDSGKTPESSKETTSDSKIDSGKKVAVSVGKDQKENFLNSVPKTTSKESVELPKEKLDAFLYYLGGVISPLDKLMEKINGFALGIEAQDRLQSLQKRIDEFKAVLGVLSSKKLYQRTFYIEKFKVLRNQIIELAEDARKIEEQIPSQGDSPDSDQDEVDRYLMQGGDGLKFSPSLSLSEREGLIERVESISSGPLPIIIAGSKEVISSPEVQEEIKKKKDAINRAIAEAKKAVAQAHRNGHRYQSPRHRSRQRDRGRGGGRGGYGDGGYGRGYGDNDRDYDDHDQKSDSDKNDSGGYAPESKDKDKDKEDKRSLDELLASFSSDKDVEILINVGREKLAFELEEKYFSEVAKAFEKVGFDSLNSKLKAITNKVDELRAKEKTTKHKKVDKDAIQKDKSVKENPKINKAELDKFNKLILSLIPGIIKIRYAPSAFLEEAQNDPKGSPDKDKKEEQRPPYLPMHSAVEKAALELLTVSGKKLDLSLIKTTELRKERLEEADNDIEHMNDRLTALHSSVARMNTDSEILNQIKAIKTFSKSINDHLSAEGIKEQSENFYKPFDDKRLKFGETQKNQVAALMKKAGEESLKDLSVFLKNLQEPDLSSDQKKQMEAVNSFFQDIFKDTLKSGQAFIHSGLKIRFLFPMGLDPAQADKTYVIHFNGDDTTYRYAYDFIEFAEQIKSQKTIESLQNLIQNYLENNEKKPEAKSLLENLLSPLKGIWHSMKGIFGSEIPIEFYDETKELGSRVDNQLKFLKAIWTKPLNPPATKQPAETAEPKISNDANWKTALKLISGTAAAAGITNWATSPTSRHTVWNKLPGGIQKQIIKLLPENILSFIRGNPGQTLENNDRETALDAARSNLFAEIKSPTKTPLQTLAELYNNNHENNHGSELLRFKLMMSSPSVTGETEGFEPALMNWATLEAENDISKKTFQIAYEDDNHINHIVDLHSNVPFKVEPEPADTQDGVDCAVHAAINAAILTDNKFEFPQDNDLKIILSTAMKVEAELLKKENKTDLQKKAQAIINSKDPMKSHLVRLEGEEFIDKLITAEKTGFKAVFDNIVSIISDPQQIAASIFNLQSSNGNRLRNLLLLGIDDFQINGTPRVVIVQTGWREKPTDPAGVNSHWIALKLEYNEAGLLVVTVRDSLNTANPEVAYRNVINSVVWMFTAWPPELHVNQELENGLKALKENEKLMEAALEFSLLTELARSQSQNSEIETLWPRLIRAQNKLASIDIIDADTNPLAASVQEWKDAKDSEHLEEDEKNKKTILDKKQNPNGGTKTKEYELSDYLWNNYPGKFKTFKLNKKPQKTRNQLNFESLRMSALLKLAPDCTQIIREQRQIIIDDIGNLDQTTNTPEIAKKLFEWSRMLEDSKKINPQSFANDDDDDL
jgi:hypothetical protein